MCSAAEARRAQVAAAFFGAALATACEVEPEAPQLHQRPSVRILEPVASYHGHAGDIIEVRGALSFQGVSATLTLAVSSADGCQPVPERTVVVPGFAAREANFPFRFDAVKVPGGGGVVSVTLAQGTFHAADRLDLVAPEPCPDCPIVEYLTNISGAMEPRHFYELLMGSVTGHTPGTAKWSVVSADGRRQTAAMPLTWNGTFHDVLVPLGVGLNRVVVEADNEAGTGRCGLLLEARPEPGDKLLVSLGWDRGDVDLDLHLVPPGGSYGLRGCSAAVSAATRDPSCEVLGDAVAYGPESLVLDAGSAPGAYGVLAVGFSGPPGTPVGAYLQLVGDGAQLATVGPRDLVPARGEIWVVGVATLDSDGRVSVVIMDEVIDQAPTRAPESWPPY